MIHIAIVEDDKECAKSLSNLLRLVSKEINDLLDIDNFNNGLDFIDSYQKKYDLVFMDIDMPLMNGIEASKKLRAIDDSVDLIFTTALSQYALFGYDVNAIAYLIKPFTDDKKAIDRIKNILIRRQNEMNNYYVLMDGKQVIKLPIRQITYVESYNHYCIFHINNKEPIKKICSIKSVEEELSKYGFLRSDKSYLINPRYATKWDKDSITVDNKVIPVSRSKRKDFFEKLAVILGNQYQ